MNDLRVDLNRIGLTETGVFVRAKNIEDRWESVDISELDATSLHRWLRSRGGDNPWAEGVVAILLGHDPNVLPWVAAEDAEKEESETP